MSSPFVAKFLWVKNDLETGSLATYLSGDARGDDPDRLNLPAEPRRGEGLLSQNRISESVFPIAVEYF